MESGTKRGRISVGRREGGRERERERETASEREIERESERQMVGKKRKNTKEHMTQDRPISNLKSGFM